VDKQQGTKMRRTKIISTIGPATDKPEVLKQLILAGTNLVRINMSHGDLPTQLGRIQQVKNIAKSLNQIIGILIDLQGPKIRIAKFKDSAVNLKPGAEFVLDASLDKSAGTALSVGLDYPDLTQDVFVGDTLLLDDGRIVLKIKAVEAPKITCEVIVGGTLSNNKGLNRKGGGLSAPALTDKDKQQLEALKDIPVDYIALSFVRDAQDILSTRDILKDLNIKASIIAKIERVEAVKNIDEILAVADAVMVARGDLGVEMGYAELPAIQKHIIARAEMSDKAVIVATQMMESMIKSPIPTRAEVSDVANAVLDGTDAVMLSAETATGDFPLEVIQSINEICLAAEKHKIAQFSIENFQPHFGREDEAIAMAAMYVANHISIKAIVALTETGSTPLWMSRIRSSMQIYGLSRHIETCGKMTLFRGVVPVLFNVKAYESWQVTEQAIHALVNMDFVQPGEKVIVTKGNIIGIGGKANSLRIVTAE
jgi:pyruvate kinase